MTCVAAVAATVDAARVLAERDRILASSEFNPAPGWRERVLDWLADRFENVLSLLAPGLRPLALVVLVLALLALVFWLLPSGVRARTGASPVQPAPAGRLPGLDQLRGDARAALLAGRLADAIRFCWLAAVALLDRAGLSVARAARADWEHVDAAGRRRPQLLEPLSALALEFQRTHFGKAPPGREQADRCLGLLAQLERELGG